MSRGPLPSQLCLLSELPTRELSDKVRFLGCVISYSIQNAVLEMRHMHPEGAELVTASVDVNLLLNSVGHEQTAVGSWLNVIGYVKAKRKKGDGSAKRDDGDGGAICWDIYVQAITLWPAGALDVQQYEKAFPGTTTTASTGKS